MHIGDRLRDVSSHDLCGLITFLSLDLAQGDYFREDDIERLEDDFGRVHVKDIYEEVNRSINSNLDTTFLWKNKFR